MSKMSLIEYRRRVFNTALLEGMCRIHGKILNGDLNVDNPDTGSDRMKTMAHRMCTEFYDDVFGLKNKTIRQTKESLSESVTFIQDLLETSEAIAEQKMEDAKKAGIEMDNDQEIELGDEDKEVLDQLFNQKSPDLQVEQIRDATVKALLAEDKKAQELKDALSIANSKVSSGGDMDVMKETVDRLNRRGPTSLMNAILNAMSNVAVQSVMESTTGISVGTIMKENADEIKTRAVMLYTLYEMNNVLIKPYSQKEIQAIAESIYYNKNI